MSEATSRERGAGATGGEGLMRRDVGVLLATLVVVNATIGSGIFKTPSKVARLAGSLDASLGVWIAGGVIALCGALTLAELAASMPRTGGLYEFLRRAFGPRVAFLIGWTKLVLLIPSAVGSFGRLAAEAFGAALDLAPSTARDAIVSSLFVIGSCAVNLLGVRQNAKQQAVITAAKYAGVLALGVLGVFVPVAAGTVIAPPVDAPAFAATVTWTGCFAALVSVMWAYDGWADLASLGGEVRKPGRTLPIAFAAGTIAIVVVYVFANLGYARSIGIDGLRASTTGSNMAAANLAMATLGPIGRRLLAVLVLVSCVGGCMSSLLTGPRIFVPMATDGVFPSWFGVVSARTGVPHRAVLVSGVLGLAYVSSRTFEQLTDAFVYGFFPFYMLAVIAVFVLRRREPALARPFRVPGYPVVPVVFLAGGACLLWGATGDVSQTAIFAFAIVLAGIPASFAWSRLARRPST